MIPTKKLVMIPGPVPVSASVLSKLGSEVKAHTDRILWQSSRSFWQS